MVDRDRLLGMRKLVREVPVARPVQDYVVRLVEATHPETSTIAEVKKYVRFGSSPRGAQAMILGAKVAALRAGRFSPSFEDVRVMAAPSLRHRVLLNFEGEADAVGTDRIVAALLERIPET